jgi:hypothetical protein
MTDRSKIEEAILKIAGSSDLLKRFKANPAQVGGELGLDEEWSGIVSRGERDRLRSIGLSDGITILVSRWFSDDIGDSKSAGKLQVDTTSPIPDAKFPKNLVFAGGCSHVPDLLARPEIDPPDAVQRLLDGYAKLAEKLERAKADLLIATSDCHFQTFRTGGFVVGTAPQHRGSMGFFKRPDIDLGIKGDPAFARADRRGAGSKPRSRGCAAGRPRPRPYRPAALAQAPCCCASDPDRHPARAHVFAVGSESVR